MKLISVVPRVSFRLHVRRQSEGQKMKAYEELFYRLFLIAVISRWMIDRSSHKMLGPTPYQPMVDGGGDVLLSSFDVFAF